jgi:hypothetical protein
LLQVRGSPASGKTTLAKLLGGYIDRTEGNSVSTTFLGMWPHNGYGMHWEAFLLKSGWTDKMRSFLIIDEAQTSYWDVSLWNDLFKQYSDFKIIHIILFASYGSPEPTVPNDITPWDIPQEHRITLHASNPDKGIPPVGLFFTEFEAMSAALHIDGDISSTIIKNAYNLTLGHTGAFRAIIDIVLASDVSQMPLRSPIPNFSTRDSVIGGMVEPFTPGSRFGQTKRPIPFLHNSEGRFSLGASPEQMISNAGLLPMLYFPCFTMAL